MTQEWEFINPNAEAEAQQMSSWSQELATFNQRLQNLQTRLSVPGVTYSDARQLLDTVEQSFVVLQSPNVIGQYVSSSFDQAQRQAQLKSAEVSLNTLRARVEQLQQKSVAGGNEGAQSLSEWVHSPDSRPEFFRTEIAGKLTQITALIDSLNSSLIDPATNTVRAGIDARNPQVETAYVQVQRLITELEADRDTAEKLIVRLDSNTNDIEGGRKADFLRNTYVVGPGSIEDIQGKLATISETLLRHRAEADIPLLVQIQQELPQNGHEDPVFLPKSTPRSHLQEWNSDIADLQNILQQAETQLNNSANTYVGDVERLFLTTEYLTQARAELRRRESAALDYWKQNVEGLHPELATLRAIIEAGIPPKLDENIITQLTAQLDQALSEARAQVQNVDATGTLIPYDGQAAKYLAETYWDAAEGLRLSLEEAQKQLLENKARNLDISELHIENPNFDQALNWLRGRLSILESNVNNRVDANRELYNDTLAAIQRLRQRDKNLAERLQAEFEARGALHNDWIAHVVDNQMMTERVKNPDIGANNFKFFYDQLNNKEGVPVAHARRLLSRAFQNRLAKTRADQVGKKLDASNYAANVDDVHQTIIERLVNESKKLPDGTSMVSREQAELALKIADRLAKIEHEQALQEYTMKQNEPDKFRDYMHFVQRQLYYRGKDRTSASFIASVYLFAEPAVIEAMKQYNPDFAPLIRLPEFVTEVHADLDEETGKIQFDPKYHDRHWHQPGYTFVGDAYSFAETTQEKKELVYDPNENRLRYKLLSDVVATADTVDTHFGYRIVEGERMHEKIDWDAVDPRFFKLWINQLFNVKQATDDFFIEKDIESRKLEINEFYEGLRTPIDYTMNTTYFIRDTDIKFSDVARTFGVSANAINRLQTKEEKIDFLLNSNEVRQFMNDNGLSVLDMRGAFDKVEKWTKTELTQSIQALTLLGLIFANRVEKPPQIHGRWKEEDQREVLETAVKAGFITEQQAHWIEAQVPKFSVALKEAIAAISERMKKEGL